MVPSMGTLASLKLDESALFDHFFRTVICPLFMVETLVDLKKPDVREGRAPEDEVRIIADKVPQMHSAPAISHWQLAIQNLIDRSPPKRSFDGTLRAGWAALKPGGVGSIR
jgi:hypothetical protein